jgi:hypothetical protein
MFDRDLTLDKFNSLHQRAKDLLFRFKAQVIERSLILRQNSSKVVANAAWRRYPWRCCSSEMHKETSGGSGVLEASCGSYCRPMLQVTYGPAPKPARLSDCARHPLKVNVPGFAFRRAYVMYKSRRRRDRRACIRAGLIICQGGNR